ncbi:MAG: acyl--CoA ligase, partial [Alcaligenaceae bacterium]|nr:acyl--CoA ligase [Alcaligenaceae bacterium]
MNIANWLQAQALQAPESPALYSGAECRANYHQFAARAAALSAVFARDYGVRAGDRIALFMPNRVEYLVALYAAWWIGAAVTPINYKLHRKEAAWIIENAEASLVITDDGGQFETDILPDGCRELGVDTAVFEEVRAAVGFDAPARVEPNVLAWLFYTSGTTGRPKGVMLTHQNLVAMSMCYLCDVDSVSVQDYWLYAAPISHGAGLYNLPFVRAGGRHIVPVSRGFDAAEIFDLARTTGRLSLFAAPTMVKRMVQNAPDAISGLHTVVYGGGPMYAADLIQALN